MPNMLFYFKCLEQRNFKRIHKILYTHSVKPTVALFIKYPQMLKNKKHGDIGATCIQILVYMLVIMILFLWIFIVLTFNMSAYKCMM